MIFQALTKTASIVCAAVVLSGCTLLPPVNTDRSTDGEPTPTPIPTAIVPTKPTYEVQRGEIVNELEFSGRISPVVEEDLFFRANGRVRAVFFERNEMVNEGDVIAELEIEALERELEGAQMELERAEVRLAQAEDDLDYQINVAQTNLEIAQIRLEAMQSEAMPDRTEIAIQQKQIELAQFEVAELQEGIDSLLQSEVTQAQFNVERIQAEIQEAQVIAPFDGQLLSVGLTPGQAVEAYDPVSTIADISDLEVSADLVSSQMEDLVEDMNAGIFSSSRPGDIVTGTVRRLPYPYGSGGRGTTVEELDQSTRVALSTTAEEAGFEMGDLVRVTVELERKNDVLWLPPQALRTFDGRRFAVVQDGETQRRVDVVAGIETSDRVEIEEGLEEGHAVVGQ